MALFIRHVFYLMQTPPMTSPYLYKAGYLMKVEYSDPPMSISNTCFDYTTTGYTTTMTEVLYGRTSKYTLHSSSDISYS